MSTRKKDMVRRTAKTGPRRPVRPSDPPPVPESRRPQEAVEPPPEEPDDEAIQRMLVAAYT